MSPALVIAYFAVGVVIGCVCGRDAARGEQRWQRNYYGNDESVNYFAVGALAIAVTAVVGMLWPLIVLVFAVEKITKQVMS